MPREFGCHGVAINPGKYGFHGCAEVENGGVIERMAHDLHPCGNTAVCHAAGNGQDRASIGNVERRGHMRLPIMAEMLAIGVDSIEIVGVGFQSWNSRRRTQQR